MSSVGNLIIKKNRFLSSWNHTSISLKLYLWTHFGLAYKKHSDIHKRKHTHCNLLNISDAMISKTETTKSICESNYSNSNWATTINGSSSLPYHSISLESPTKTLLNKNDVVIINQSLDSRNSAKQMAFDRKMAKKQRHFSCTFCPFTCTWFYDLKIHLKQKHKILK